MLFSRIRTLQYALGGKKHQERREKWWLHEITGSTAYVSALLEKHVTEIHDLANDLDQGLLEVYEL